MIILPLEIAIAVDKAEKNIRDAFMALPEDRKEEVVEKVREEIARRVIEGSGADGVVGLLQGCGKEL